METYEPGSRAGQDIVQVKTAELDRIKLSERVSSLRAKRIEFSTRFSSISDSNDRKSSEIFGFVIVARYIVAIHCLEASVDRCSCLDESVKMLGPPLSLPPPLTRGKSSDMEMRDLFKNVRWFGKFRVFFVTRFARTRSTAGMKGRGEGGLLNG